MGTITMHRAQCDRCGVLCRGTGGDPAQWPTADAAERGALRSGWSLSRGLVLGLPRGITCERCASSRALSMILAHTWLKDQVQRDRDTLDGVPSNPHKDRRLRSLAMADRVLSMFTPHECSELDPCTPCEYIALLAYTYSDRPGYNPAWAKEYDWGIGSRGLTGV